MPAGMRKNATRAGLRAERMALPKAKGRMTPSVVGGVPQSAIRNPNSAIIAEGFTRPGWGLGRRPSFPRLAPWATTVRCSAALRDARTKLSALQESQGKGQLYQITQPRQPGVASPSPLRTPHSALRIPQIVLAACKGQITKRTQFFSDQNIAEQTMVKQLAAISGGKPNWVRLASFGGSFGGAPEFAPPGHSSGRRKAMPRYRPSNLRCAQCSARTSRPRSQKVRAKHKFALPDSYEIQADQTGSNHSDAPLQEVQPGVVTAKTVTVPCGRRNPWDAPHAISMRSP